MRIGEVAAEAGVNVQTIRFYERRGLLKKPRRLPSGYRDYPAGAVKVVRFIKRTQKQGFTLQETRELTGGYSFRLPPDEATIQMTAEWITLERRCCPFIAFGIEVDREGGPLWLSLTGREGVKPFLKMELGVK